MSKKSYSLIAVLSAAFLVGCQPNPTPINSTHHQAEKPKSGEHSSENHNGAVKTEPADMSHREPMNHNGMNHDEMNHSEMKSAPNAASQPYDLQFLDTMIHHHEGAVEMAKAAQAKSQNAEVKSFAAKIVADQEKEISEMKRWREQWFAGKSSALNMEMAGMKDSMKGMDMAALNKPTDMALFNLAEFIKQMTPHHEGAIVMAREALTKAEHTELKTLANQIITAQEAEIKQMEIWLDKLRNS